MPWERMIGGGDPTHLPNMATTTADEKRVHYVKGVLQNDHARPLSSWLNKLHS